MNLSESYKIIKKSIVAFSPKYIPLQNRDEPPPEYPPIIGTGFIINENGLIATNDHVAKAFDKLFKPPDAEGDWPLYATLFTMLEIGILQVPLEIIGVFKIGQFIPGKAYYGPEIPDIAFVHVKAKGLPALEVDDSIELEEGLEVATAGFPMGEDALTAPGYLHQLTPTLQRGIISAILPFACPTPHAFTMNVMTQTGASGSPVFIPETGKVIGVLYAGLSDIGQTSGQDLYRVPTNISYVVPSHFIVNALAQIEDDLNFKPPEDAKSIEEIIATGLPSAESMFDETGKRRPKFKEVRPIIDMERSVEIIKPEKQ